MKKLQNKIKNFQSIANNYLKFVPISVNGKDIKISVWGDNNNIIDTPSKYVDSLINQVEDDIFPLMFFAKGYAPFAVLRNLFCYLDHVARLRFGNSNSSMNQIFNKGDFGCYPYIKQRYKEIFQDLIQLYRHELVHQTRPLPKIRNITIDHSRKTIAMGFCISSDINKKIYEAEVMNFKQTYEFMKYNKNRKHLNHIRSTKDYSAFIVNNFCFLFDTVDYLKRYSDILNDQKKNFREIKSFCVHYIDIILDNLKKPNALHLVLDKKSASNTDISDNETKEWYRKMKKNYLQNYFNQ